MDVFVIDQFLKNIHPCQLTLVLRSQAGVCKINQVRDLLDVGVVWYFPDGVTNILSHFRMVILSGWDFNHSSAKFRETNDPKDLGIKYTTS